MKKITALLTMLMAGGSFLAQNPEATSVADWSYDIYQVNKKYPGYVITADNDTVQGFIKAQSRCSVGGMGASNQNRCEFFAKEGDKKPTAKYKPADINGYMIADKVYESIAYSGGLLKKPNFNLVVEDGAIRIYEWYSTVEGFSSIRQQSGESQKDYDARRYSTNIIIAKGGEDPKAHSSYLLKFADKMSELVSENTELSAKVSNKEDGYKMFAMFAIIREYNEWAKNN